MTSVQSGSSSRNPGSRIQVSLGLVEMCVLAVFGCTSYWVLGYYINKSKMMPVYWLLDCCEDNSLGSLNSRACGLPSQIFVFTEYSAVLNTASVQFNSVQLLSRVRLFVTPRTAARQASLSVTNSQSLLKLMSVMPSNGWLSHPLLSLSPTFNPSQYQGLFQ